MRNMSFSLTKKQFLNGTKTITRRLGWNYLEPGDYFMAAEKVMGLKKGEKIRKLGLCRCLSRRVERLCDITWSDVEKEGFPKMSRDDFISMFCHSMRCHSHQWVNRIRFEKVGRDK